MLKIIKHRDMEKFFSMKEMWFSMKQCGFLLWGGLCWESEDRALSNKVCKQTNE